MSGRQRRPLKGTRQGLVFRLEGDAILVISLRSARIRRKTVERGQVSDQTGFQFCSVTHLQDHLGQDALRLPVPGEWGCRYLPYLPHDFGVKLT